MTQTTKNRIFPKESEDGLIENVALYAFDPIKAIVEEEFTDVSFDVADEDGPGLYEFGFVPFPHVIVSLTADEEEIYSIIHRINPLVEETIARFTRQVAVTD